MSIIARALQKAQKDRERKLQRQEDELKKAKETAAVKLATQQQPQESKNTSAISEGLKLSAEQQTEIATAEATLKAEATPKKRTLLPHILVGAIILLFIGMASLLYIRAPALTTSRSRPSKTTAPRTTAMKKPSQKMITPAPAIAKNVPVRAVQQQIVYGADDPSDFPVVSGIMYSPANPQAIVNGVMVSKGDIVNGFTVRAIHSSTVTVSYGEKEYKLRLR